MVENLKVALIWEQRLPSSFVSYNMDNEAVAAKEATQKQKTSRVMCPARSSLPTSVSSREDQRPWSHSDDLASQNIQKYLQNSP